MNFFEAQDRSRRNTRRLVVMFFVATLLIVSAAALAVELGFFALTAGQSGWPGIDYRRTLLVAGVVLAIVGIATAFRIVQLGGGGARVAQELGGSLISSDTQDHARQRLRNVVEEMAIASGVPVPQIFVLEHEAGINAFAAGFSTSDAAVAVTRGALEQLNRAELQGVIAHEFSHILNGDMRLNLKLMGILFGIIVIGQLGKLMMRGSHGASMRRRGRDNNGSIALVGVALFVVGGLGVLMARLIRAGVSRQREYLADASAVQFTRQTQGIAGALAKIGRLQGGSRLTHTDGEEVSHMLIASGLRRSLLGAFATHPPLAERIRALDPSLVATLDQPLDAVSAAAAPDLPAAASGFAPGGPVTVEPTALTDRVGRPSDNDIALAAGLRSNLPASVYEAAHSPEWALYLVLAIAAAPDAALRDEQLAGLLPRIGEQRLRRVTEFADSVHDLGAFYRLPLLELCFPALKERPGGQLRFLLDLVDQLHGALPRPGLRDYALRQLLEVSLAASLDPGQAGRARPVHFGTARIRHAAADLVCLVAAHGHRETQAAARARDAGLSVLKARGHQGDRSLSDLPFVLGTLRGLIGRDLEVLVRALVSTIADDRTVSIAEAELMRLVCAGLDCPLPPLIGTLHTRGNPAAP